MNTSIPQPALQAFASLAELVYQDDGDVSEAICRAAVQIVPGADHACISTLAAGGRLRTLASSDDVAGLMDQLESEAGEGPCLDSIEGESFNCDPDITTHSTWPALARLTLARTPVRGMVGYRLMPGGASRAALNIFSDTAGALTGESADIGALLAAFASVSLTAEARRKTAEDLRRGLASNREIGQAVGLIMAAHSVDASEAFEVLRSASTRTNTKLAVIAAQVTAAHRPG